MNWEQLFEEMRALPIEHRDKMLNRLFVYLEVKNKEEDFLKIKSLIVRSQAE